MITYKPIACSYYDYLLEVATFKKLVSIVYLQDTTEKEIESVIRDVYTKKGVEFLITENGITIQLDKLLSVDGHLKTDKNCNIL
tara:strand:- start:436 stop:687 length:252 start_codon:yes stop_codon:yes gene_type:complete